MKKKLQKIKSIQQLAAIVCLCKFQLSLSKKSSSFFRDLFIFETNLYQINFLTTKFFLSNNQKSTV